MASAAGVLLVVTFLTSLLLSLAPGDPALTILGPSATPERVAELHQQLGLDQSPVERYLDWLGAALQGDLGQSLVPPGGDVTTLIMDAAFVSLEIAILASLLSLVVAIPLAMLCAVREGGYVDRALTSIAFLILSVPPLVLALLFVLVFTVSSQVLPRSGWARIGEDGLGANLEHVLLPVLTLALFEIAVLIPILRSDLIRTMGQDFVATARAKGLGGSYVMFRHVLRPSCFSLLTLAGLSFARLIGGTVLVEVVFSLPGLGQLLVRAVNSGDFPVVQGVVVLVAAAFIIVNLAVDVMYGVVDPRSKRD